MANPTPTLPPVPSTIANLPLATTPLSGPELVPISQGGVTKSVPASGFTIQGPTGATGPAGPAGPQGAQGPAGGVANINSGTTGQLGFYASNGQTISPATVGSGLQLVGTTLSTTAGASTGGIVNKFRNGTFDVWQRGLPTSRVQNASVSAYTTDGWILTVTGGTSATWGAQTNISAGGTYTGPCYYGINLQGNVGTCTLTLKQRIESYIAANLAGMQVTVQAWIFNSTGGTLTPTLTVNNANSQDNFGAVTNQVNAVSMQACPNNAWTNIAYTFAADAAVNNSTIFGLEVIFGFGSFSTGESLQVTNCDIRATAGVATGINNSPPLPEVRPIGIELPFCQRYYTTTFGNNTANGPGQNAGLAGSLGTQDYGATAGEAYIQWEFPVQMRAAPSVTTYNPSASNANWRDKTGSTDVTVSVDPDTAIGTTGVLIGTTSTSLTAGHHLYIHATASAEL